MNHQHRCYSLPIRDCTSSNLNLSTRNQFVKNVWSRSKDLAVHVYRWMWARRWPYVAWVACLYEWPFGGSVITCSRNNERLILSSYLHSRLLSSSVTTYRPFVLLAFQPVRSHARVLWFNSRVHVCYICISFFYFLLLLLLQFILYFCLLFPLPIVSTTFCRRTGEQSICRVAFALHPALTARANEDKDLCRTGEAWEAEARSRGFEFSPRPSNLLTASYK